MGLFFFRLQNLLRKKSEFWSIIVVSNKSEYMPNQNNLHDNNALKHIQHKDFILINLPTNDYTLFTH